MRLYAVPESTLCEDADRYVVALALPCHCAPNPAAPSPSTPRCVFTPHNTPADALYAEKSALALPVPAEPRHAAPCRATPRGAFTPQYRLLPIGITLLSAHARPGLALPHPGSHRRAMPLDDYRHRTTLPKKRRPLITALAMPLLAQPSNAMPQPAIWCFRTGQPPRRKWLAAATPVQPFARTAALQSWFRYAFHRHHGVPEASRCR